MLARAGRSLLVAGSADGGVLVGVASPASAVTVANEAELRAAFATETQIDVQADIVLTDCTGGGAIERTAAVTDPVTVDGHGHTVLQTCADNVFLQDGSGLFTVQNLTITGGHASGNGGGIFAAGPLTLQSTTIYGNRANAAGGGDPSLGLNQLTQTAGGSNGPHGIGGGDLRRPPPPRPPLPKPAARNNPGGRAPTP